MSKLEYIYSKLEQSRLLKNYAWWCGQRDNDNFDMVFLLRASSNNSHLLTLSNILLGLFTTVCQTSYFHIIHCFSIFNIPRFIPRNFIIRTKRNNSNSVFLCICVPIRLICLFTLVPTSKKLSLVINRQYYNQFKSNLLIFSHLIFSLVVITQTLCCSR